MATTARPWFYYGCYHARYLLWLLQGHRSRDVFRICGMAAAIPQFFYGCRQAIKYFIMAAARPWFYYGYRQAMILLWLPPGHDFIMATTVRPWFYYGCYHDRYLLWLLQGHRSAMFSLIEENSMNVYKTRTTPSASGKSNSKLFPTGGVAGGKKVEPSKKKSYDTFDIILLWKVLFKSEFLKNQSTQQAFSFYTATTVLPYSEHRCTHMGVHVSPSLAFKTFPGKMHRPATHRLYYTESSLYVMVRTNMSVQTTWTVAVVQPRQSYDVWWPEVTSDKQQQLPTLIPHPQRNYVVVVVAGTGEVTAGGTAVTVGSATVGCVAADSPGVLSWRTTG